MPSHRPSTPPPAPPLQPHEMTTEHLLLERRSSSWDRSRAARQELERRESARHESMCALVDRMVARMEHTASPRMSSRLV